MTGKEKVERALDHQEAAVPLDFGSNACSGMHISCVKELRSYLGLEEKPVKVVEPYQMLGEIDEELKEVLGIDTEHIFGRKDMFGLSAENYKEWRTPWGQNVLVPGQFETRPDGGGLVIFPEGDTSVPPSGKMAGGSFFFDSIIRQEPIDDAKLDPQDNLEEFSLIDDDNLHYLEQEVKKKEASGRALMGSFGGTALGDIAMIPASFLKHPKGIRDVTEWYVSTAIRQDYIHKIFEAQVEIALKNLTKIHKKVGNKVAAVYVCGTDFGTQISTFCSEETLNTLYLPYYKKINNWIHKNTTWKTFKHSCGAIEPFIPSFIEAGFDILNPVQCSAVGMEAEVIKERYGDKIVFWGGGVDTQKTLPFGTPGEVRREVLTRCRVFSKGGGFVFNAIHNVQAQTPVENIVAMINAVKEFNGECQL